MNKYLEQFENCEYGNSVDYPCSRCSSSKDGMQEFLLVKESNLNELSELDGFDKTNSELFTNIASSDFETTCCVFQCQICSQLALYYPHPIRELHFPSSR